MSARALLATCAQRGVTLTPEGDGLRVRGPRPARDELLPAIRKLKPELLAVLKRPALPGTTSMATTHAPSCPGPAWQKDWCGRWVNLAGLHGGGDALPN
jgi:hypothetical protein